MDILVTDLRAMIKNLSEAVTIVPLLKDYLDAGIRNDEQLIKLASVIQKLMTNKVVDSEGGFTLTEEEKKQLMANVESVVKETSAPAPSKSADELLAEINNAKK